MSNTNVSPHSWGVTMSLCVTLGNFGAHRLYTGYRLIGGIQCTMFCAWLGWMGWSVWGIVQQPQFQLSMLVEGRWSLLLAQFVGFVACCVLVFWDFLALSRHSYRDAQGRLLQPPKRVSEGG